MLVKDLKANVNVEDEIRYTPLILVCAKGRDDLAKCLIELESNIEQRTNCKRINCQHSKKVSPQLPNQFSLVLLEAELSVTGMSAKTCFGPS